MPRSYRVGRLCQLCPQAKAARELVREVFRLVCQRQREALESWMGAAESSGIAGMSQERSDGPVQGQFNRLKLVKCQR
jgi:hypothetical protein